MLHVVVLASAVQPACTHQSAHIRPSQLLYTVTTELKARYKMVTIKLTVRYTFFVLAYDRGPGVRTIL